MVTIIGISGGSCSGKTSISKKFNQSFGSNSIVISEDSFYKSLSITDLENIEDYEFDVPSSIDFDKIENIISNIKFGVKKLLIPIYDFNTHSVTGDLLIDISSVSIIIFEGIFLFYYENIRNLLDIRIFIDTDSDIRLSRRINRDIHERERSLQTILSRYEKFVKPSFHKYVDITKKYSNIIIPFGIENYPFIDIFCHIFCKYTGSSPR